MHLQTNGVIKLRRQLKTSCDLHASFQDITTYEDLNSKFYNINLSTLHHITEDKHNTLCIELRDEGALIWTSRIVAIMADIIINFFEQFLHNTELKSDYCISCSSSRVALLTFK